MNQQLLHFVWKLMVSWIAIKRIKIQVIKKLDLLYILTLIIAAKYMSYIQRKALRKHN